MSTVHAQPTTNVTVSSAPVVPTQPQAPQDPPRHQAKHQPPAQQTPPALFRLHTSAHEAPPAWRVLTLSAWAAICIFIGLIPAGRLMAGFLLQISFLEGYAAAATSVGMLGVALIALAFASIHRARLPWFLMTIATLLLAGNVAMVYVITF